LGILSALTWSWSVLAGGLDPRYDELYPLSAEFCGTTDIVKKAGFEAPIIGGRFGHGFLYLHGACRDMSSTYPKIKICGSRESGEKGVGVSVNSDFQNVNWTAVQSRQFFFHGLIEAGQPLTREIYLKTKEQAKRMGILRGVEMHEEAFASVPSDIPRSEYMYQDSYGTDFAITNSRGLYCVRVPLDALQLQQVVRFFNDLNTRYQKTKDYEWKPTDNCTTTTNNALAVAGIWASLPVDNPPLSYLEILTGQVAIPLNNYIRLVDRTNDLPLENLYLLFSDREARKMLLERGRLPTQPGALTEFFPVSSPNEVYQDSEPATFIDLPIFHPRKNALKEYMTQPRYRDLRANLLDFQKRLLRIQRSHQADRYTQDPDQYFDRYFPTELSGAEGREEFRRFHRAFYDFVEWTLRDIDQKLILLDR
jgi:hypothetical protein